MNKVKLLINLLRLTQAQVRPKHQVRSSIDVLFIGGLVYQVSSWDLMVVDKRNQLKVLNHAKNYSFGFKPDLFILDDLYHTKGSI